MKSSSLGIKNDFIKARVTIILSCVICSCQKDNTNKIAETADAIEGDYELVAMHWDGDPIDINGDSTATTEIFQEIMSLPSNSEYVYHNRGYSLYEDRTRGAIRFELPMQGVNINYFTGKFNKSYLIGGSLQFIIVHYDIKEDGSLEFEHFDFMSNIKEYDSREEMKKINDGTVTFNFDGELLFSVNYTLYDYKTDQIVSDRLHYTFKKK